MTIPYQPTVATVDALPATTRPTADDAVLAAARGVESIIAEHAATCWRQRLHVAARSRMMATMSVPLAS